MNTPTDSTRRQEVWLAWRTALPACAAFVPLGLALGVLVTQSGLAWWWAPILAVVVFAGSLEFLMVGMLAAVAPLSQIAVSALLVNFRHVFYAITFPRHRITGKGWRAYAAYALTDEAYALTATPRAQNWSGTRILALQILMQATWVSAVAVGAGLGVLVPEQVVGLDFAVTALFVILFFEAFRAYRSLPIPILAFACAIVALIIAPSDMLLVAMGLFVAALVALFFLRGHPRSERAGA